MAISTSPSRIRAALRVGVVALALVGIARTASSADDKEADARLQKLTVVLKQHDVGDTRKAATAEIGKAEALRDKARAAIGQRKEREALARTLDELEGTLSLVEAKIKASEAKAKLEAAKAKRAEIKAQLAKIRAEADDLEKQQQDVQKKLGGGT